MNEQQEKKMYKKDLKKLDTDDLMSIKDDLRILKTFLFNIQSLNKNLKNKRNSLASSSRQELRKMWNFYKISSYNVDCVLHDRLKKKGKYPTRNTQKLL